MARIGVGPTQTAQVLLQGRELEDRRRQARTSALIQSLGLGLNAAGLAADVGLGIADQFQQGAQRDLLRSEGALERDLLRSEGALERANRLDVGRLGNEGQLDLAGEQRRAAEALEGMRQGFEAEQAAQGRTHELDLIAQQEALRRGREEGLLENEIEAEFEQIRRRAEEERQTLAEQERLRREREEAITRLGGDIGLEQEALRGQYGVDAQRARARSDLGQAVEEDIFARRIDAAESLPPQERAQVLEQVLEQARAEALGQVPPAVNPLAETAAIEGRNQFFQALSDQNLRTFYDLEDLGNVTNSDALNLFLREASPEEVLGILALLEDTGAEGLAAGLDFGSVPEPLPSTSGALFEAVTNPLGSLRGISDPSATEFPRQEDFTPAARAVLRLREGGVDALGDPQIQQLIDELRADALRR